MPSFQCPNAFFYIKVRHLDIEKDEFLIFQIVYAVLKSLTNVFSHKNLKKEKKNNIRRIFII